MASGAGSPPPRWPRWGPATRPAPGPPSRPAASGTGGPPPARAPAARPRGRRTSPPAAAPPAPTAARLRPGDLAGLASVGLRTRKLRAALSALGIAIGVAAIVAVLGLAQSSQAGLLAEIGRLGTNLLTVTNGQGLTGGTAELPIAAPGMGGELHRVTAVQYTGQLTNANAYHSPYRPS